MERKFNPRITEIKTIGDELRFQREYYNFKNTPYKLIPRKAIGIESKFLGDVLQDYLYDNFKYMNEDKVNDRDNYGEYGCGEDLLYAIEHNKLKSNRCKKSEKYNPNAYYLRMYSLFKIYGFLDDYDILLLLRKYNIKPRFEKSKLEAENIIKNCKMQYENNSLKRLFHFKSCYIHTDFKTNKELEKEINVLQNIENRVPSHTGLHRFPCVKKLLIEKFVNLSETERKCKSLDLGKETSFANNVIENKIEYITYETLLNIIDYLNLQNTDFSFLINKKINEEDKNIKLKLKIDVLGLNEILS